ncbi:MAG: redoxin domain-containing protein [Planctomycetes bacterium]|nr:redoxin domain-containing protein [Planctomycetota bacterium]
MVKFTLVAALLASAALVPAEPLAAQIAAGGQAAGEAKAESTGKVGEVLPNVSANVVRGDKTSTVETAKMGKPTVFLLVGVTCPVTKPYAERIAALEKAYMEKGVDFVHVYTNVPEKAEMKAAFHKEMKFAGAFWNDEKAAFAKAIKAGKTGEAIIVGKDGKVMYRGGIDDSPGDATKAKEKYLANALDELLAGKEITKRNTMPAG